MNKYKLSAALFALVLFFVAVPSFVSAQSAAKITMFASKDPNPVTLSRTVVWGASGVIGAYLEIDCKPGAIYFKTDKGNYPTCEKGGLWSWPVASHENGESIVLYPSGNTRAVNADLILTLLDKNGVPTGEVERLNVTFPPVSAAIDDGTKGKGQGYNSSEGDIQAKIDALLEQIKQLKSQLGNGSSGYHAIDPIVKDRSSGSKVKVGKAEIIGASSKYTGGDSVKFSVRGTTSKGEVADPSFGLHVQSYMQTAGDVKSSVMVDGVYQSVNADYNYETRMWDVAMTAPRKSGTYEVIASFYCSNSSAGCVDGQQIDETFKFKVGAGGYVNENSTRPVIKTASSKGGSEGEAYIGEPIIITGKNLAGNSLSTTHVYLGGMEADLMQMNDNMLWAITPPLTAGTFELVVSNEKGTSDSVKVTTIKVPSNQAPRVSILSPRSGQTWEIGETKLIKWKTTGSLATRTVHLVSEINGVRTDKYIGNTNGNELKYEVSSQITPAGDYTLWVCGRFCPYDGGIGSGVKIKIVD